MLEVSFIYRTMMQSLVLAHQSAVRAFLIAITFLVIGSLLYIMYEPLVSRSQVSDTFEISQTITGEISFLVAAADVTMDGALNGITGGYATGTTNVVVSTNDSDGYNMTIKFPYATTTGMDGDTTATYINNYTPASAGVADYNWVTNSTGGAAEFGYTVSASTSADVAPAFQDDGISSCGAGGNETTDKCWLNASTTAQTIINRTSGSAADGATTTIKFKVAVPSNPSPALDADTYTATATLTATNN